MPLPLPSAPVQIPGGTWQDRGNAFYHEETKSTRNRVSAYKAQDVCGRDAYQVFSFSGTVNKMVNCVPVTNGSISISGRVPIDGIASDVSTLVAWAESYIIDVIPIT